MHRLQLSCLGRGELGHSLGALGHGVLGQLARQDEAHSGLDLARGHCGLLVVAGQLGGLSGNLLKDVVDEGVQDGHGLGADTRVGVHLRMGVAVFHSVFAAFIFEKRALANNQSFHTT